MSHSRFHAHWPAHLDVNLLTQFATRFAASGLEEVILEILGVEKFARSIFIVFNILKFE